MIDNFISNGKFTNFTNGLMRVTVIAENMAKHNFAIFSTLVSIPETGVSLPLD